MDKNKWRVGNNSFGTEVSLDISSLETFKNDSISSFAREIVQNSIDAKRDDQEKVIIEFQRFDLKRSDIPGHDEWTNAFDKVLENWDNKGKTKRNDIKRMKEMLKLSKKEVIQSMRVSDYNTTGLVGVSNEDETSQFYSLVKGEGSSFKGSTAGGSKGIGKYASFVVSKLHTVFYSTKTIEGEIGYIGRAILPSGIFLENEHYDYDNTLKTDGQWYYANTKYRKAILEELILDQKYTRRETGTDVYVFGFDFKDDWKENIIFKILESFIVAIVKGTLEVIVDNTEISRETVEFLIDNLNYKTNTVAYKNIAAQYELLTDKETYHAPITIIDYGEVDLYVKSYKKENSKNASNRCSLVRYPFMKIKDLRNITIIPFSALAVIKNDKVNETLRKFENPEHTSWHFGRNDYSKEEQDEGKKMYSELESQIKEHIYEYLSSSDKEETDVEGAGQYLPQTSIGEIGSDKEKIKIEKVKIHKSKVRKNIDEIGYYESDIDEALNPELTELGGEEFLIVEEPGILKPINSNENPGVQDGNEVEGLKKSPLKGIRYNLLALNQENGEYMIRFYHFEDLNNCDLTIDIVGDNVGSNEKHPINILEARVNDMNVKFDKNKITDFNIIKDTITNIYIKTDQKETFSGRISVYANR